ncbi:Spectrin beta chain, non-erythrocytic 1 [Oryzias melastigma]|uniref:Spectrin beta chain, non-erythrocytic 1 n=1 Tax=Oryzias melastigma TaxID=30732 RepID=A0A834C6E3_ORYME|nr:Spectrin beta chain, non-erythrocytic 1 [Oryzias melastigma]
MTSVAAEFEHMEIQQQYNDGVNNRWDADDWDNENSSARLFERSRIKALAGVSVSDLLPPHTGGQSPAFIPSSRCSSRCALPPRLLQPGIASGAEIFQHGWMFGRRETDAFTAVAAVRVLSQRFLPQRERGTHCSPPVSLHLSALQLKLRV